MALLFNYTVPCLYYFSSFLPPLKYVLFLASSLPKKKDPYRRKGKGRCCCFWGTAFMHENELKNRMNFHQDDMKKSLNLSYS